MLFGPLAHLSGLAGGVSPFDIRPTGYSCRPTGYSCDEAYALLSAVGEQGRRYYADRELLLDMFAALCDLAGGGAMVADDFNTGHHGEP